MLVRGMPRMVAAVHAVALTLLVVYATGFAFGARAPLAAAPAQTILYDPLIAMAGALVIARGLARRPQRAAWACLGAGLVSWAAGDLVLSLLPPPVPFVSDALMLTFGAACCLGLLLLTRSHAGRTAGIHPAEAVIALVVMSAVAAALFGGGHDGDGGGALIHAAWPAAALVVAVTAWLPPGGSRAEAQRPPTALVSGMLALPAIAVLAQDVIGPPLSNLAVGLGIAALAAVLLRLGATVARAERRLQVERRRAANDALTGLPNREQLLADLELALRNGDGPSLLLVLDLDGFKTFNETFGRCAGDELLERLAERLRLAIERHGRAYRLGGDEFGALVRGDESRAESTEFVARWALTQTARTVEIAPACGRVELPREAPEPSAALALADRRMSQDRNARRGQARALRTV
jgi:diguanylate cyclase (GGDEF)-like protein